MAPQLRVKQSSGHFLKAIDDDEDDRTLSVMVVKVPGETHQTFDERRRAAEQRFNSLLVTLPSPRDGAIDEDLAAIWEDEKIYPQDLVHHAASTYVQGQTQHLLTLPRELRDMIYTHVVSSSGPLTTKVTEAKHGSTSDRPEKEGWFWDLTGLLHASSQLRKEALALFYKLNTFEVYQGNPVTRSDFFRFIENFVGPANALMLKKLRVVEENVGSGSRQALELDLKATDNQTNKVEYAGVVTVISSREECEWLPGDCKEVEIPALSGVQTGKEAVAQAVDVYDEMAKLLEHNWPGHQVRL